jgi:hypothetical protein
MKKPPFISDGFCPIQPLECLLQLGRDAGELAVERAADGVDSRDDYNGNAGCDEAIFDRGSARLVLEKRNDF